MKMNKLELKGLFLEILDALNQKPADKGSEEIVTDIINQFAKEKEGSDKESKAKQDERQPDEGETLLKELNEKMKDYPATEKEVASILKQLDRQKMKQEVTQISKQDKEEILELSKEADRNPIAHQKFKNRMKRLGLG